MNQLQNFAAFSPIFYSSVKDFPDFSLSPPLNENELVSLEKKLEFALPSELKELFKITSSIRMNGLILDANQLGTIQLPNSPALILGYFYLYNAADRLLLLPNNPAIFYLEQYNGSITNLAANLNDFLEKTLPRYL